MDTANARPFSLSAIPMEPWRNGGGITGVIASGSFEDSRDEWDYRLSVADISANGPFSTFQGIERCTLLLEGSTLSLEHDGRPPLAAGPLELLQYDGEWALDASIGSVPARCLNVMTRRGVARAALAVVDDPRVIGVADLTMVLSLHQGCVITTGDSSARHTLNRHEGILLHGIRGAIRPAAPRSTILVSITRLAT